MLSCCGAGGQQDGACVHSRVLRRRADGFLTMGQCRAMGRAGRLVDRCLPEGKLDNGIRAAAIIYIGNARKALRSQNALLR